MNRLMLNMPASLNVVKSCHFEGYEDMITMIS